MSSLLSLVACAACEYLHCEHVARRCSGHDQIGRVEEHLRGLVLTIRQDSNSSDLVDQSVRGQAVLPCDPLPGLEDSFPRVGR